jgi:hypothetical protein
MDTKKKIIENELMKEIVSIRVDALWKMLNQKKDGLFPEPYEEGPLENWTIKEPYLFRVD